MSRCNHYYLSSTHTPVERHGDERWLEHVLEMILFSATCIWPGLKTKLPLHFTPIGHIMALLQRISSNPCILRPSTPFSLNGDSACNPLTRWTFRLLFRLMRTEGTRRRIYAKSKRTHLKLS